MTGEGHFEHTPDSMAEALSASNIGEIKDVTRGKGPNHIDTEMDWPAKENSKKEITTKADEIDDLEMSWDTSDQRPN